jgi:hypothetical protein
MFKIIAHLKHELKQQKDINQKLLAEIQSKGRGYGKDYCQTNS